MSGTTFVRQYHFPPFPSAPQGVKIIPFKDFTEYGARVVGADGVERDGLGIPTIALKNKKKEKPVATGGTSLKREWWEGWKLAGQPLRGSYDPKLNRADRLYLATTEFSKHYNNIHSYQHLQKLWATFRTFIGAGSQLTQGADEETSDDDGDVEEITIATEAIVTNPGRPLVPPLDTAETEDKTAAFFNDPAQSITIFLSSYMHAQGQLWDRLKLVSAPHLMRFFVDFLLVNHVLPECAQGLQDAHKAIDLAAKELPLTYDISNALPDAFSAACQAHWGRKAGGFLPWDLSDPDFSDEPSAKRAKLSHSVGEADNVTTHSVPVSDAQDVDIGGPTDTSTWGGKGWGGNSGWGGWVGNSGGDDGTGKKIEAGAAPVSDAQDIDMPAGDGGWDAGSGWGDAAWATSDTTTDPPALGVPNLEIAPRPTLVTLLGPTAFPLTHAPGIVEWSLRRIKSVSAPPPNEPPADGAEGIERGLEARMYRMVLEPWVGPPATADAPHILKSSNGPLAPAVAASPEHPKPHDMLKDDITVLVEPGEVGALCVGMGVVGTWVQLARVQDQEAGGEIKDVPEVKKNLTKGQKSRRGLRYWYIDELVLAVPSYWAV
ncbi:hypothetical protein K438DRAFT_1806372 [Mycena galopus ATCC 62051]|nr:hypothetical protein K438DRAFT_1806372 [Mycena galopus ATCC 62051]